MLLGLISLLHSQASNIQKHFASDFPSEGGCFVGRCDNNVSKFGFVVKCGKVSLIKRLLKRVGEVERLFEISVQIFLHNLNNRPASSILINIIEQIHVDKIELDALLCVDEVDEAWIAGEVRGFGFGVDL